jgi:hypothetical protein
MKTKRQRPRYDPRAEQAAVDADLVARRYTGAAWDLEAASYRAWVRGVPGRYLADYNAALSESTREHARDV